MGMSTTITRQASAKDTTRIRCRPTTKEPKKGGNPADMQTSITLWRLVEADCGSDGSQSLTGKIRKKVHQLAVNLLVIQGMGVLKTTLAPRNRSGIGGFMADGR